MNSTGHLTILQRILFFFLTVSLFSSILYMYFGYTINRDELINGIDKRLLISAETIDQVVKPEFYDTCSPENSVPGDQIEFLPKEDPRRQLLEQIRYLQDKADLQYLYTVMLDDQGRYFLPFGSDSGYTTLYDSPSPEIVETLKSGGVPNPQTIEDPEYGTGRAVLIRRTSPQGKYYVIGAEASLTEIEEVKTRAFLTFLSISVGSFIGVALVGLFLAGRLSKPIQRLTDFVVDLRQSGFSPEMHMPEEMLPKSENVRDETLLLADGIARMQQELIRYIDELKTTTQSKERAESELRIAGDIQLSMLPKTPGNDFPIDLTAHLKPAREAGGDLYDFIRLDEDRVFFAVGDVSGKGMPAALFMAMTLTLIRSAIRSDKSLQETMLWTNNHLCIGNDSCTFVTLLIGIFDTKSGEISICNGGHNPPVLRRRNGQVDYLPIAQNMLVGIMEQDQYELDSYTLQNGDSLILYSDGITEAMNCRSEIFDEQRLLETVRTCPTGASSKEILEKIQQDVSAFVNQFPQSDDMTILVMGKKQGESDSDSD